MQRKVINGNKVIKNAIRDCVNVCEKEVTKFMINELLKFREEEWRIIHMKYDYQIYYTLQYYISLDNYFIDIKVNFMKLNTNS